MIKIKKSYLKRLIKEILIQEYQLKPKEKKDVDKLISDIKTNFDRYKQEDKYFFIFNAYVDAKSLYEQLLEMKNKHNWMEKSEKTKSLQPA